jgi:hypothetical protein
VVQERHAGDGVINRARRDEVISGAQAAGLRVEFGHDRVLQLDLDSAPALATARERVAWAWELLGVQRVTQTKSRTKGWHLYVYLQEPITREARVALVAALGSDPKRAILDWRWAASANPEECFLIEKEPEVEIDLSALRREVEDWRYV